MNSQCVKQSVKPASAFSAEQLSFDFMPKNKPIVVKAHDQPISGDAGLLPIRQFDDRVKYTERFAACLGEDPRRRPQHSHREMSRQRIFGILAGYEDCNDHDMLNTEPVFKMIAGRGLDAKPLASQPTLSRFENGAVVATLQRLLDFTIETGIEHLQQKHGGAVPECVTLDIDTTDAATHGQQQLTFFHGYYDQYQYLPLIVSEPSTKHVFLSCLRHGTMHPSYGAGDEVMRVAQQLRARRGDVQIHVRGDADFGVPRVFACCEAENNGFSYTFGLRNNKRLKTMAAPAVEKAKKRYERTGTKQRVFMRFMYQAKDWDRPRLVIAKAEHDARGTNLRFVVTSREAPGVRHARRIYDDYTQRGESEQRMCELKNDLRTDRLSCHRFFANFMRLLLHTTAYNLLNALRDDDAIPDELRAARPETWRTKVIKVAARPAESCRRFVVELAAQWPFRDFYFAVSRRALGAEPVP